MLHDSIKLSTEELIGGLFVIHLATLGVEVQSRRPGGPGEPDIVCADAEGRELGIEITAGHSSEREAAQLRMIVTDFARQGKRQTVMSTSGIDDADLPPGVIRNPDAKLAASLQRAMEKKKLKFFRVPTYLVLDGSWAPLTSAADAPTILAGLRRPSAFPYVDVFLCLTRSWPAGRGYGR